jgi:hypothetical protein
MGRSPRHAQLSLSRFNHGLPGREAHPEVALVGFQGRGCAAVVQPQCCPPFLLPCCCTGLQKAVYCLDHVGTYDPGIHSERSSSDLIYAPFVGEHTLPAPRSASRLRHTTWQTRQPPPDARPHGAGPPWSPPGTPSLCRRGPPPGSWAQSDAGGWAGRPHPRAGRDAMARALPPRHGHGSLTRPVTPRAQAQVPAPPLAHARRPRTRCARAAPGAADVPHRRRSFRGTLPPCACGLHRSAPLEDSGTAGILLCRWVAAGAAPA